MKTISLYRLLIAALVIGAPGLWAEDLKSADDVLNRYLQAIGGRERVLAVTSMEQSSLMTMISGDKNLQGSVELYVKAPDRMLLIQRLPKIGEARTGYDGTDAWVQDQAGQIRVLEGAEKESVQAMAQYDRFARYEDSFPKRKLKGLETLNGRKVYVLELSPPTGRSWSVYVDSKTFFIAGMTIEYVGASGAKTQVHTVFSDYREAGGVMIPFRRVQRMGAVTLDFQLSKVRVNVPIKDEVFKAPVQKTPDVMTDE